MYAHMCASVCVQVPQGTRRGQRNPDDGIPGGYEQSYMGAGKETPLLWKSSTHPYHGINSLSPRIPVSKKESKELPAQLTMGRPCSEVAKCVERFRGIQSLSTRGTP